MKLSVDCNFPATPDGRQQEVSLQLVQIANEVLTTLLQQFMGYGRAQFVELIRVRFTGGPLGGFMTFTVVTSVRLFDLRADSRREVETEYAFDGNTVACVNNLIDIASEVRRKTCDEIDRTLSACKRHKVRFLDRHKIIEMVE